MLYQLSYSRVAGKDLPGIGAGVKDLPAGRPAGLPTQPSGPPPGALRPPAPG